MNAIKSLNQKIQELQATVQEQDDKAIKPTNDIHQIRLANKRDIDELMKIYQHYNNSKKYRMYRMYNKKEFEHLFLPKKDMVYTYVLTNSSGQIKDFVCINMFDCHDTASGTTKKIAYVYYISFLNEMLLQLFMKNILYILKESGVDSVWCHEWFGVSQVLCESLSFEPRSITDKGIGWYAFNYNTKVIQQSECGLNLQI